MRARKARKARSRARKARFRARKARFKARIRARTRRVRGRVRGRVGALGAWARRRELIYGRVRRVGRVF